MTGSGVEAGGVVSERIITDGRVVAAFGVAIERLITVGRVGEAGGIAKERSKTSGRVAARGVAVERCVTIGSVEVAVNVERERKSPFGTVGEPGSVAKQRINASGGVVAAAGIAQESPNARRRVVLAGSVVIERFKTKAAVPDAACEIDQDAAAIGRIAIGQNAVQICGLRLLHKRKAGEQERNEK